jgi:Domain of unknown function (DUF4352)
MSEESKEKSGFDGCGCLIVVIVALIYGLYSFMQDGEIDGQAYQWVKEDSVAVKVSAIEDNAENLWEEARSGKFIAVNLEIHNESKSEIRGFDLPDEDEIKLIDKDGNEYSAETWESEDFEEVNPDGITEGKFMFDVKNDLKPEDCVLRIDNDYTGWLEIELTPGKNAGRK